MTITPPSEDEFASAPLQLAKPEPEVVDTPEQATSMLPPITHDRELVIGQQAKNFTTDLVKFTPQSPEFQERLRDLSTLASAEIKASTQGPNRMLERSGSSVAGSKKSGGDASQRVAGTLATLRSTVEDLTPNQAELTGPSKILGFIPGGNKLRRYFQRYQSAQVQLDNIIKSLLAGQDELTKDNASLQQEKNDLWDVMKELNEYGMLAGKIDAEVVAQVAALRNAGNVQGAQAMETDVLFAIRQRRQDILTQLAVSVQGYMAMTLVQKNNQELIKGVERARTTTITALRTAVIVAQALDNQRLVLDQIDAVNKTTNNMIEGTSAMLRQQTGRIHEQATNSGVAVETLTKAFDDIYATLDQIDTFKAQANDSMDKTIGSLQTQLERARPALDRVQAIEASGNANQKSIGR